MQNTWAIWVLVGSTLTIHTLLKLCNSLVGRRQAAGFLIDTCPRHSAAHSGAEMEVNVVEVF